MRLIQSKKAIIAGREIQETGVYLISFKEEEKEKICHAKVEKIEGDSITVRTNATNPQIKIAMENLLEIKNGLVIPSKELSSEQLENLVHGKILTIGGKKTCKK